MRTKFAEGPSHGPETRVTDRVSKCRHGRPGMDVVSCPALKREIQTARKRLEVAGRHKNAPADLSESTRDYRLCCLRLSVAVLH